MSQPTPRKPRPGSHRSAGEGSVYKNGSRWRGALTWTAADGTRARRVVSGRTQAEARENLDELRRELRLGPLPRAGRALTLAEYLPQWLERDRVRVRPSTWRSREQHVRCYLVPALGRLSLARLAPADVERALSAFLASGRPVAGGSTTVAPASPRTVHHVRATLRRALADAVRDGLTLRNAASDARPPRVPHRAVNYLAADDVRRLLTAVAGHEYGPLWTLAATTGLRLGEVLGLAWADVDTLAGTLTVRQSLAMGPDGGRHLAEPKSARSRRTLLLPAAALAALTVQRQRQDAARAAAGAAWQDVHGLVFTDSVGRPCSPDRVSHHFQVARAAAGLPHVRLHDLRHSAATLLLASGVPLIVISELLGHSSIAITQQHYAAVVPQLRRDAATAMDRALTG